MYLSTFRKHGAGPGNWGTAAWWGHMADTADIQGLSPITSTGLKV